MGARANFVLIDAGGMRLHYSHWGADRVCSVLAAGPAAAVRFISEQHRCDDPERDWLNDAWAEGGAVVDRTARRLLFYGDQLMLDLPCKRAFLALLEPMWPGWTVRWAYDGIGDLAAAAGLDRSAVRSPDEEERHLPEEAVTGDYETYLFGVVHLLTVRTPEGCTAYPLGQFVHTAWQGPALLDRLPAGGLRRVDLGEFPSGGLHVDAGARTAGVWIHGSCRGLVPALGELWPGWRVEFWEDRYEEQFARCGGAVTAPDAGLAAALDQVVATLGARRGEDPARRMLDLVDEVAGGRRVELNPLFTAHRPVDASPGEWESVLRAAAGLRARFAAGA
ncbi:hypothetical protein F8568_035905 [Actinomadura sp. LD22]|uniref:Uncharacterized protein n=1 Tax=Actinomadura physcomitrii TaxID=2650748 RepID=A0A6I4MIM6_9ACTN|nr:hypothetical protein [Actinomadura physcomitrii]MWA05652.1 hypothetical protein [Actinomadura physcomitrii]